MKREGRVRGKLTNKSRVKGCCFQKSKQKKLKARYKRFADDVRTNPRALPEFLHHSPVKELQGFLHLVSDIAHDMMGHEDEGAEVQSGILAVTVHSIMKAAFA